MVEKILSLMSRSEIHRKWTVEDIGRLIIPAIIHNKIRFYVENGKMLGFTTFAFLSEEAEKGYLDGTRKLQPADFKGEEGNMWFIDFVAPYGHTKQFVRALRKEFNNYRAKTKRIKPNKAPRVIGVYGVDKYNEFYK